MSARLPPIHPGEVLKFDFMEPLGLSARALGAHIGVPPNRISAILRGSRGVTGDTALRLGKAFKVSPEFWLNLQKRYELECAEDLAQGLEKIHPFAA